ncbi:MAG: protein kinase [Ardenticatenales bacterium]
MTAEPPLPVPAAGDPALVLNDRYRLLDVIGEGGMAVVWRAEDALLSRVVAVKLLRDQFASDPEFLERFRSEARSAAALNQPGVVGLYDVGKDGGRHYLVMEFVPGRDLKSVIRHDGPLAPGRAVEIAAQLARAVGAAHSQGLIHRDLKPQNVIMASATGRPKVADFGIARAMSDVGITTPGVVMGTVHYLAPEQAAGKSATPASDVYSLGVVLYEMLTGDVPFEADSSLGVAMRVLHEDPQPVEERSPAVPPALAAIVRKAMARDPGARYPDAGALADALDAFRQHSEQHTGPTPVDAGSVDASSTQSQPDASTGRAAARPTSPRPPDRRPPDRRPPALSVNAPQHAGPPQGPLLDWSVLGLGALAVVLVGGVILLWYANLSRIGAGSGPSGATKGPGAPATAVPATPTMAPAQVQVPDVMHLDEADGRATLQAKGFAVSIEPIESGAADIGRVVHMQPDVGETVDEGDAVKLQIGAHGLVTVPGLADSLEAMEQSLSAQGLVPAKRSMWSADTPAGAVIGTDPPAGGKVPVGASVWINYSSGTFESTNVTFEDGVYLEGVNLPTKGFKVGDTVSFTTAWEAVGDVQRDLQARFFLGDRSGDTMSAEATAPLAPDRPSAGWGPGDRVVGSSFAIVVPSGASGMVYLWVELSPVDAPTEPLGIVGGASGQNGVRARLFDVWVDG